MTKKQWLILGGGFVIAIAAFFGLSSFTFTGHIPMPQDTDRSITLSGYTMVSLASWVAFVGVLIGTAVLVRVAGKARTVRTKNETITPLVEDPKNDPGVWPPPPKH
jgi:hypothetical protein